MGDRLQELAVFVRAAESGSFSRAARELGLSQPSVSRIVGELEERLGAKLLLRTTRRITLTHSGELFLERAREILAGLEDAEDAARGLDSLRGLIRLALPVIYGTREVIPRLAEFLAVHPQLRVEMTVSDERQNLVADGADVAIRLGALDDSAFGARASWERWNACSWPPPLTSRPAVRRRHPPILHRTTASSVPVHSAARAGRSQKARPSFPSMSPDASTPIPARVFSPA